MSTTDLAIWEEIRSEVSARNRASLEEVTGLIVHHEKVLVQTARQAALAGAALVADQVEATARPGDGKDAAAEIGRRIRAMMEEGR